MTRYSDSMREILYNIREGFSPKQIKMAIGIAADKRYARGNYSGAVRAIEKIKKGLSDHPQVAAVLKRLNTDFDPELKEEPASPDEGSMAVQQLEFMMHAIERMKMHIAEGGEFPEWMQNKLSGAHEKLKGLYANIEHGEMKEEVELDENASKAFDNIIKTGGVDKKDFQKAKQLYTQGKLMDLRKHIYNLDTDPLETIMDVISTNDSKAFMKMYPKSKKGEYMSSIAYAHKEETLHDMQESTDPKIVKAVDKLKKGDTVEIEYDSSIKKGHKGKFKVTAKNTVNKGRTIKTTLQNLANPSGVKHYIYQYQGRDGAYFAIGDMGASMKSLKAGYGYSEELEEKLKVSDGLGAWIDDFKKSDAPQFKGKSDEEKKNMAIAAFTDAGGKLDEGMKYTHAVVDPDGKVAGMSSNEKDAKDIASRHKGKVVKLKKPMSDKKGDMMINRPFKEEDEKKMDKPDSAKAVDQMRDDKKKTRIAQLQLQIAKAQETINKLNAQEKPSE